MHLLLNSRDNFLCHLLPCEKLYCRYIVNYPFENFYSTVGGFEILKKIILFDTKNVMLKQIHPPKEGAQDDERIYLHKLKNRNLGFGIDSRSTNKKFSFENFRLKNNVPYATIDIQKTVFLAIHPF